MILSILSGICLVYFVILLFYAGPAVLFSWFWLAAGAFLAILSMFVRNDRFKAARKKLPLAAKVFFWTTAALAIVIVILVEIPILRGMFAQTPKEEPDIILVLGSSLNEDEISPTLQLRLDKAIELLKENPKMTVILSGGTTGKSEVSEAYAMTTYLVGEGISPRRIQVEPASTSTLENLAYSTVHIKPGSTVGIISNSFHMFRALRLAEGLGIHAIGIPAASDKLMLPSQMMREFFAVVVEYFRGNL